MANLLFDGFELYSGNRGSTGVGVGPARPGGSGQGLASGSGQVTWDRNLFSASNSHVFAGAGLLCEGAAYRTQAACNMTLYDGATAQIGWRVNSDGSVGVYRGADNTATLIGTTAAGVVPLSASGNPVDYKMIELDVVLATGATGSVNLYVGDNLELTVNSVQTTNSGVARVTMVRLNVWLASFGVSGEDWDDLYVNDDSGGAPENARFGEAFVVEPLKANAAGTYSEWTKGGTIGANNFNQIDDYPQNADTDYVLSATVNQRDSYNAASLVNGSGTVICFEHDMYIRKDDVANRKVAPFYRSGGNDYVGADQIPFGTYALKLEFKALNPDTGLRWTIAEINALEFGVKLTL